MQLRDLRKNLHLKAMAVVLAFGAWVWVASQGDLLKTVQVPVELSGFPADLEIVGDPPEDVSVRLRGSEVTMRTLSPERVRVVVNLATLSLQPGLNRIPLDPRQVRLPAGVEVDRLHPNVVELNLERAATREVAVEPVVQGLPASGYTVASVVVRPERVVIEGAEPAVKEVESVTTPAISIDGATQTQRLSVIPLVAGPVGGQVRLADPKSKVEVTVLVRPLSTERVVAQVAVVAEGAAAGAQPRFRPARLDVRVRGPAEAVAALRAASLEVVADLSGMDASAAELPPARLRARLRDADTVPSQDLELEVLAPGPVRLIWEAEARR